MCGSDHVSKSFYDPTLSSTDVASSCDKCVFDINVNVNTKGQTSKTKLRKQRQKQNQCRDNICSFQQSFTEGSSMSGYEVEDMTWLGTSNVHQSIQQYMHTAVPLTFGCQTSETGLIASQYADGILGLSLALKEENIVTKLYNAGVIPYYAFSMCLTRQSGILGLGGTSLLLYDENDIDGGEKNSKSKSKPRHLEAMQMVPISKNHGYYSIQIINFQIGGKDTTNSNSNSNSNRNTISTIFNSGKGTIVDSGTSDTYLPKSISKEFRRLWETFTDGKKHSNTVVMYSFDEFQKLPNVTFTLENGYEWTVQPWNYMEPLSGVGGKWGERGSWDGEKGWINRIYLDESSGCVLGANAMFGHDILFDIANAQIGVAEADCSSR